MVAKFAEFPKFKLKYLENQENYFSQTGLNYVRVFKNFSYEINLYQQPCSSLKRCYPAFHLMFYTIILVMKLKDLQPCINTENCQT